MALCLCGVGRGCVGRQQLADMHLSWLQCITPQGSQFTSTFHKCVTVCHRCVTNVSQKCVTDVSQMCHRCVTRCRLGVTSVTEVSQEFTLYRSVTVCHVCVTNVSPVCHVCHKCVMVCHGCVTDVSRMCHRCVTDVSQSVTRVSHVSQSLQLHFDT